MATHLDLDNALARIAELEQQRAALVEALKEAANVLEWAGAEFASQRARAALRAAGVELP